MVKQRATKHSYKPEDLVTRTPLISEVELGCTGKVEVPTMLYKDTFVIKQIKVITKLPNSEQSYKGKVKTHNYINRQDQSTTGKL
jgi:hypothetical protein